MPKTKTNELTARQQEILDFICACIVKRYPPTLREIGKHFRFSEKAALDHVNAIERKGYIERFPKLPRGIKVMDRSLLNRGMPVEVRTLEITSAIAVEAEGFGVGEFIRLRKQEIGQADDIVLLDADGRLILRQLTGHIEGIIGKVVGHTFPIG